jgi:hypothetical protein
MEKGLGRHLEQVPSASEISYDSSSSQELSTKEVPLPKSLPVYRPTTTLDQFLCGTVIGPTNLLEAAACPCCKQSFDEADKKTLNEPHCYSNSQAAQASRSTSLLKTDDSLEEEEDIEDDYGVLAAGVHYNIKRVMAEGWLHKKGTGQDWLGSRGWKARWARLALAHVDGFDTDVPLLLIFWFPSSSTPSTIIVLDSTVVMAVDAGVDRWNSYRFEIRHIPKKDSEGVTPVTRTFTAPRKGRDAWVYAISKALLTYEKKKDEKKRNEARKMATFRRDSHERPISPTFDDDRFVSDVRPAPKSPTPPPPTSPKSPASPKVPRPSRRSSTNHHPLSPPLSPRITP